jgi:dTDP-4-dehydrorhamnose reductase
MFKVCAVVLTYNRRGLLDECLQAVTAQTHACDRIVVVDNASTDGTATMVAERWAGRVDLHVLGENIGAAGGFNLGMRLAFQTGADYIWVMDDDVLPEPDALAALLAAGETLEARGINPAFLTSLARAPGGEVTNVPELDRRPNVLAYENWPDLLNHGLVPVTRAALVSNLFPRATLARHGLPIAAMFIWGEDSEFTLRVSQDQPGYLVGASRAQHVRQLAGVLDIRTERNPARIGYHFHRIRNDVFMKRRFEGPRAVARLFRGQVKLALQLCRAQEFGKAGIVLRGLLAGLSFNPPVEAADAPCTIADIRHVADEPLAAAVLAPTETQAFSSDMRTAI